MPISHPQFPKVTIEGTQLKMGEEIKRGDRFSNSSGYFVDGSSFAGTVVSTKTVVWVRPTKADALSGGVSS